LGKLYFLETIFPYNIDFDFDAGNADANEITPMRVIIDVLLLGFFAIPHTLFARPGIKKMLGENKEG
jgi:hypothetical protein